MSIVDIVKELNKCTKKEIIDTIIEEYIITDHKLEHADNEKKGSYFMAQHNEVVEIIEKLQFIKI